MLIFARQAYILSQPVHFAKERMPVPVVRFITTAVISLSLSFSFLLSLEPLALAAVADPGQFILDYYAAKAKVKFPLELHGYFSKRLTLKQEEFEKMRKQNTPEFQMMMSMYQMVGGDEPTKIKVLGPGHADASGREVFEIAALEIPAHYKKMMTAEAQTSLKGVVALVREGDHWLVDKDFWTFDVIDKDGKVSETSGFNDDKEAVKNGTLAEDSPASNFAKANMSQVVATSSGASNKDDLLDRLMQSWKVKFPSFTAKTGKAVYAVVRVDNEGQILDVKCGGEKLPQPLAESQISDFLLSSQPFKPLPKKYDGQTNAWMMFDWSANGEAISGPYFSDSAVPESIFNKVHGKVQNQHP